jgi:mycothiol synthase
MPTRIVPASIADAETIAALVCDPALHDHFDTMRTPERVVHDLSDPLVPPALTHLALIDGDPVGFVAGFAVRPPDAPGWVYVRLGVIGRARRRGAGRALLATAASVARERDVIGAGGEVLLPMEDFSAEGRAFAQALGGRIDRYFWRMRRPRTPVDPPVWPDGITVRIFDGSARAFEDWNNCYVESFSGHYRPVPGTVDLCREIAASPDFLHDGLILAYRDDTCVGFCRNETAGEDGVIGLLGVVPSVRGTGLGRALLRWGVAYFTAPEWKGVGLGVDGANERATRLYTSEGFAVDRRREIWVAPIEAVVPSA